MARLLVLGLSVVASLAAQQLPYERVRGTSYKVSYDERAFTINGERQLLHVGAVHYPRATPEMWPQLMQLSRDAGLNVIDTYMFWNIHEETEGEFDFETGVRDFIKFIEIAGDYGLFVQLRIGPYVCAEWTLGAIPAWLLDIEGMVFRTYNTDWMFYMERFTRKVVELVEERKLFPSTGGPVIFLQVENEYGDFQELYGEEGERYVDWCADMALNITDEVPWFMCQQPGAPLSTVETRNGYYADQWLLEHFASGRNQPGAWTENWPGWFQLWGESVPKRPAEDIAFAVARWFQYGGTLQTYYMWFGGTNFGRNVGGPFIITSYDYDVPLNEYGFPHPVKFRHFARLHRVLDLHAEALLQNPVAEVVSLGPEQEVSVYGNLGEAGSVIFLANVGLEDATVTYNGYPWTLPAWSVTIVNGAIGSPAGIEHVTSRIEDEPLQQLQRVIPTDKKIEFTRETPGPDSSIGEVLVSDSPLSQLPITLDTTDYFWYTTVTETRQTLNILEIFNVQNVISVWVDGTYIGTEKSTTDNVVSFTFEVAAGTAEVKLDILTMSMGLWNYGPFLETTLDDRGLNGAVLLNSVDITQRGDSTWSQQPSLTGEFFKYWQLPRQGTWSPDYRSAVNEALVWFDIELVVPVDTTNPTHAYALDLSTMGKGAVWINGNHLGRFWDIVASEVPCDDPCDYRGEYYAEKCRVGCGELSQSLYHVPRQWFHQGPNRLVLFTETGGNPDGIQLVQIDTPTL